MRDRLTDIEIKIAHLEHSLGELSDVLYNQQQLIDRLQKGLETLAENRVLAGDDAATPDAASDKPPHY